MNAIMTDKDRISLSAYYKSPFFYLFFVAEQMLRELTKLIHDEDESMYDFLASMLVGLPNMAYSGFDPNYLAHEMTKHVHGQLFNDTIDYLLGTSMQGKRLTPNSIALRMSAIMLKHQKRKTKNLKKKTKLKTTSYCSYARPAQPSLIRCLGPL